MCEDTKRLYLTLFLVSSSRGNSIYYKPCLMKRRSLVQISHLSSLEGVPIANLYIVSFENDGSAGEEDVVKDDNTARVCQNDPWWDDKISDDEDVFDVDYSENGSGASKPKATNSSPQNNEGHVDPNMDANVDNEDNGSNDEDNGIEDESDDNDGVVVDDTNAGSGTNNEHFIQSFEDVEVDDNVSNIVRSDILDFHQFLVMTMMINFTIRVWTSMR
jgi:hypothetical protein